MFIVFEGVDGCGKDTQLELTLSYLRKQDKNVQIWVTKEPTCSIVSGKKILKKLSTTGFKDGREALELFARDREEQTVIRREILKHSIILSSRFDYSTYAYQGVQGISFKEIEEAHNYKNIIIPDITFIFDVSIDNIKKRLESRGTKEEAFEKIDFLSKVREKYLDVYKHFENKRNIFLIDGNLSKEEVFEQVKTILETYLGEIVTSLELE